MVERDPKEGHRVIDTGPYGLVRHPIYTGLIGAILATGAAIGTVTALLGALLVAFGLWQKARMEEGFLTTELGADYTGLTAAAFQCSFRSYPTANSISSSAARYATR